MPRGSIVGSVLALAASVLVLALQPFTEPWWEWADPDGAYTGSSFNILLGNHTNYLDHPGLPTQGALAIAFGAEYRVGTAMGSGDDRVTFVNEQMLDLDRTRPIYRGWAMFLFIGSALLVYALVARLLGHWTWGVAGTLIFLSAPGLAAISFLLRPDAALAALCLAVGYLTVTAFEPRSAIRYLSAAVLLGLALTFKLPAIAMALPLVVAVAWKPPERPWLRDTWSLVSAFVRRHALWIVPLAVAWFVLCWVFNRERIPIVQTDDQRSILVNGATVIGGYAILAVVSERFRIPWADRIFRVFYALLAVAFVVGLAIPASLVLDDGIQMLVTTKETLMGERVNEGVEPFGEFTLDSMFHYPRSIASIMVVLGVAGGVLGIVRRTYWPSLLALGGLALALMAAARYSYDYYYVPAVTVMIPGALWLAARSRSRAAPVLAWIPVLVLFGLSISHYSVFDGRPGQEVNTAAQELADELLRPGEVALVPNYYYPIEDVRFDSLVDGFVDHVPDFPYRFLSRPTTAAARGLTPAYYVAPYGDLPSGRTSIEIAGLGPYVIEKLPKRWGPADEYGVARIVSAPALEP